MEKRLGRTIISVSLILAMLAGGLWCLYDMAKAEPVDTYHSNWQLVRDTADEDGATFAAVYNLTTAGNFAGKDSSTVASGGPFRIPSRPSELGTPYKSIGDTWMFAICGKDFNNVDDTFSFNIIGWAEENGMLQTIAEGNGVLGTQAVIVYPDGGDALGELVSETGVTYTNGTTTFTDTSDTGSFSGTVAGMMAYVTGTNITSGYYQVTTVTDANTILMSGISATGNNTDSTVKINPSFWADTITLDETTKWPTVSVKNSGDNEVALIVVELTGLDWIQFVLYDCDGETGDEAGEITVYGRPW